MYSPTTLVKSKPAFQPKVSNIYAIDSEGLIPIKTRNNQNKKNNTNITPKIGTTVVRIKYPATKVNPIPTPAVPAPTRGTIPGASDSTVLV
tara:strand:+ start:1774 stop:2046 length:273 start_codon:yes stop_codon:yes gene_type:complete